MPKKWRVSDAPSLDQLRVFVAAVESGGFSATARKLRRAQSVISEAIANLEQQLGVPLFERSGRRATLTSQGRTLLIQARSVIAGVDDLKATATAMSRGLEAELSFALDVMFPPACISAAAGLFSKTYPKIPLHIRVEVLGAAIEPVINRHCGFGVVGSLPMVPPGMVAERLTAIPMMMVAARNHPLAMINGAIRNKDLAKYTQLVTTDRSALSRDMEFGVMSPTTWRLTDLSTKRGFLIDGLGFGGMPEYMVRGDIAAGTLVHLEVESDPPGGMRLPLSLIYPADNPPGQAGQCLISALRRSLSVAGYGPRSSPPA